MGLRVWVVINEELLHGSVKKHLVRRYEVIIIFRLWELLIYLTLPGSKDMDIIGIQSLLISLATVAIRYQLLINI